MGALSEVSSPQNNLLHVRAKSINSVYMYVVLQGFTRPIVIVVA
jgi:hypothetical protein